MSDYNNLLQVRQEYEERVKQAYRPEVEGFIYPVPNLFQRMFAAFKRRTSAKSQPKREAQTARNTQRV